ncbi:unnamed protein product [Polarella glacialis]|uniref:Uncharacterized protein n=1 Tax=Polarella glacialis TaxID=89957 RepID=A0A813F7L1_POLGL|nr:unnamed protein product [Polarella glacialis]
MFSRCPGCGSCEPLLGDVLVWRVVTWSRNASRGKLQTQFGSLTFDFGLYQLSKPQVAEWLSDGSKVTARIAVCRCRGTRGVADILWHSIDITGDDLVTGGISCLGGTDPAVSTSTSNVLVNPAEAQLAGRAVRLLTRDISRWENMSPAQKEEQVGELKCRLTLTESSVDWRKLVAILREAAAALSAPRRLPEQLPDGPDQPPDQLSLERLRASAARQRMIRDVLIRSLEALESFERDDRINCILHRVHTLISRFEARVGNIFDASSGKTWVRIQELIGSLLCSSQFECRAPLHDLRQPEAKSPGAGLSGGGAAAIPSVRNGRGKTRNRVRSKLWKPRGSKNIMERGLLERLMKTAMERLPQRRGTYKDVVEMMSKDTAFWSAQEKLDTRLHVEKGKTTTHLVWHFRVGVRMSKYFKKTGLSVEGKALWEFVEAPLLQQTTVASEPQSDLSLLSLGSDEPGGTRVISTM